MTLNNQYVAVTVMGRSDAWIADPCEWADPTLRQGIVATRPYGWHPPVLYIIPEDGDGEYEMYQLESCGVWLAQQRVNDHWWIRSRILPDDINYDAIRCYLAGIDLNTLIFGSRNLAARGSEFAHSP